jgi:hypothetical protein
MTALRSLTDGVWDLGDVLSMPGGIRLPSRTTILRDADGGLLLYGPLKLSEEEAAAIDALGEVRTIVGPSLFHHLYLRQAKERWPEARLLGAEGLDEKRATLDFDGVARDGELAPGVHALTIQGMPKLNEVVLVHEPSATLVCADLCFRIREAKGMSKVAFKLMNDMGDTLKRSRLWKWSIKDPGAYRASLDALLAQDFDGVVMAHGDPVLEGGKSQLEEAMR